MDLMSGIQCGKQKTLVATALLAPISAVEPSHVD